MEQLSCSRAIPYTFKLCYCKQIISLHVTIDDLCSISFSSIFSPSLSELAFIAIQESLLSPMFGLTVSEELRDGDPPVDTINTQPTLDRFFEDNLTHMVNELSAFYVALVTVILSMILCLIRKLVHYVLLVQKLTVALWEFCACILMFLYLRLV